MCFRKIAIALGSAATCLAATAAFGANPATAPKPPAPVTPPLSAPARALAAEAPAGAGPHALESADLSAWLDGFVPFALQNGDIAGAVVVVVKDGKVLFEKGYGYADVANRTPMDPDRTMVRIGSTSKLFTWTAVMQLAEQGKLDLNRNINDYLDFKVPEKFGKPITLTDLMNHRGGFEEGLKDVLATDPRGLQSTEQYLKRHPRPMLFPPGEVPAYSNYGAALAGYIVERVSGEPYERYVERHILLPLGMTSSNFDQPIPDRFRPQVSNGYRTASGPPQPFELVVTRPAGSGTATASDMARFMIAHLQNGQYGDQRILGAKTAELMHSPSAPALPGFDTMAHGFFYQTRNGRVMIGHGGDTQIFHTELDLLPQQGVGIFYNFNSRGRDSAVYGARQALIEGFMDRYFPAPAKLPEPPALPSAQRDAQAIAGHYQSSRRIEHGFLSLFYVLQQTQIVARPDGAIIGPGRLQGHAVFHEIAPQRWREVGGTRQLALTTVSGVKTVVDSEDPISVLQAVPAWRSAPLNLAIFLGSLVVLIWTLVLWPLSALLRRGERAESGLSLEVRRVRLVGRFLALGAGVYLAAWYMLLKPVLDLQLEVYSPRIDVVVSALEILGFLTIPAAAVSIWVAWRMFVLKAPWLSRIWSVLLSAALVGVVWLAVIGRLIGFNLNY